MILYLKLDVKMFSIGNFIHSIIFSFSERHKDHEAELLARQYLEQEQRQKEEKQRREIEDKEEMRRMLLEQMEEKAAEEASNNLRVQNRNIHNYLKKNLCLSWIVLTYTQCTCISGAEPVQTSQSSFNHVDLFNHVHDPSLHR